MGNRGSSAVENYRLISDKNSSLEDNYYNVFQINGGQIYAIKDADIPMVFCNGKIKNGIIDKNINVYVIAKSFNDVHDRFISQINPNFYDIYTYENEHWIGKERREMLVKPKISTKGNLEICKKYFRNIIIERQGKIDNVKYFKNKPNCIVLK